MTNSSEVSSDARIRDVKTADTPGVVFITTPDQRTKKVLRNLADEGIDVTICPSIPDYCATVRQRESLLLADLDFLTNSNITSFLDILRDQPTWATTPLVLLSHRRYDNRHAALLQTFEAHFDIAIVPYPLRSFELMTAVRSGLRSLERQETLRILFKAHQQQSAQSRADENLLREVIDNLFSFVGVMTPDGKLIEANRAALEAAGLKAEDVIGKPFEDTYWWDYDPDVKKHLRETIDLAARGKAARFDVKVRVAEQQFIMIDFMLAPLLDENGGVKLLIPSAINITERKDAEKALERAVRTSEEERARLQAVLDVLPVGVYIASPDGKILSSNAAGEAIWGKVPRTETIDQYEHDYKGWWVKSGKRVTSDEWALSRALKSGEISRDEEIEIETYDGTRRFILNYALPFYEKSGQLAGAVAVNVDITERKRAEIDQGRLAAVVESSYDAIIAKDLKGVIMAWNRSAERMFGYSRDEAVGRAVDFIVPEDKMYEELWIRESIAHNESVGELDTIRLNKDGERIPVSLTVSPITDHNGRLVAFSSVARDISERKRMEEQLRHEALHDRLTGLPNRALFRDRVAHAIAKGTRSGANYSVMVLDMDNFKVINDSLGHLAGDEMLRQFARRVRLCLRPTDTLARFGGDEFTILLDDSEAGAVSATRVAQRIGVALQEPFIIEDHEVHSGASIGIALGASDYVEPEQLLRDADAALYVAKEQGKNRYIVFDAHMRERAISRLKREADLRRALQRNEFVTYYQPIVDVRKSAIVGCEALVRWNNPNEGLLGPDEFVYLAEETGLIVEIGEKVINDACQTLSRWRDTIGLDPSFYVSVNLSARQFFHAGLVDMVAQALQRARLSGNNLRLEIVETIIIRHDDMAGSVMQRLRDMGVRLCMDDFGTGYSSLSYLHQFPVDVIKVDRSFIHSLVTEKRSLEIVRSIVDLASNLELEVVAEGPENGEQLDHVKQLGFRLVQGFYLHHPMQDSELAQLLAQRQH